MKVGIPSVWVPGRRRESCRRQRPLARIEAGRRPALNLLLLGPGTLANPLVAAVLAAGSLLSMFAIASWLIARFPDSLGLRIMAGVGATLVVVVLIATLVLTVVLLAAHSALHWPVRKYGLLLAASYTAGSGAPYWTGRQVLGRPTTA